VKISWMGATAVLALAVSGPASADTTLNGSGSTFQKAYQEMAIDAFRKTHPDVVINYGGGGSGKGRQDLADRVVDFAGADAPYKQEDMSKIKGGPILYFPLLLGPITLSYNLEGVDKLRLSPVTIAKIFQRQITKWNDHAIAADNPGVKLPDETIVVAHRADGSGTTENFTKYLEEAARGIWKLKSGASVEWPADTQAGNGNPGVAQIVKSTPGAIGYVDLSDAKASGLVYASVKNQAGKYVEPTAESASLAGDGIKVKDNLLFSAINAKGEKSYPITYQTWVIVYAEQKNHEMGTALKAYVDYLLTGAQKFLPELDYAPLPKGLQARAVKQLQKMKVP
jgi:phosphate transport system substrate-binding protein